jgi:translocation and assembly module TamB
MPRPPTALRIWLKRLLVAALGLAGTYLLLAHLFLMTPLGPWAVNRRPERLTVTWESAWSLWPGEVRVRGLRVRGKTRRVSWSFEADRGRGWIDLAGLLVRRFEVRGFEGEGVRSSTSREPAAAGPPARPAARRRRKPWTVRFPDVSLAGVREIGINGFRFEGDGRAAGGFSITLGGPFHLEPTSLALKSARLSRGEVPLASGLDLAAEATIGPYVVRKHPGLAAFDFLTGTLTARGDADLVKLLGGSNGSLAVDLRMDRGRLATGTLARLRSPEGTAVLSVSGGVLELDAAFRDPVVGRGRGRPPFLQAASLRLGSTTRELRPSRLLAAARRTGRVEALRAVSLVSDISFEELRLAGTAGRTSWQIAADRGSGRIALAELLRRRVALAGLDAEGITAGAARGPERPPGETRKRPWSVEVEGARLAEVRALSLDDLLLEGNALLAGSFALGPEGRFGLKDATASLAAGRLTRSGEELARNLAVRIEAGAAPFSPRENPGMAALRFVSGTLRAEGRIAQRGPGRMGTLDADVRLDRGRLTPGTRAALRVRLPSAVSSANPLAVNLALEPGKAGPRLRAAAEGRDVSMGFLRCGVFRLSADSPEVDLAKLLTDAREIRASGEIPALAANLRVEGLRLETPAGRLFWRGVLDRGTGRLDLPALQRREIVLGDVRGEGFSLRLEPMREPARRSAAARPWSLSLGETRFTRVRELALGDQRILGSGRLDGRLTFSSRGELDLRKLVFDIPAGRMVVGGETVARDLAIHTEVRLAPLILAGAERAEILRRLTVTGDVRGQVASLGFLDRYLKKDPRLGIEGQGRLDAKARLAGGRLLPGTRLRIDRARVQAEYLESRATGDALVTGSVEKNRAVLRVLFDRFQSALRDQRDAPAHLRGRGLRLAVSSSDLDLATPVSDLRATIDLPEAEVVNLDAYNAYLPPGTGVEILGGAGRLSSRLDLDVASGRARGEVSLTSSAVRVQFQDVEIQGDLNLKALLSGSRFQTHGFRLDGTRLDLRQVVLREIGEPEENGEAGWWARLELTDGDLDWKRPFGLRSSARLSMRDSGLFLSLFSRKRNFLSWFKDLLTVRDLTALADVRLREGAIEIDPLHVTGGKLDLRSRLRFTRESKRGDLLLRWGRFTTGIELRDGKRDFKLVRPVEWYEAGGGLE